VGKGPKREPARRAALIAACLVFVAGSGGAAGRGGDEPAGGQQPGGGITAGPSPGGRAVEPLLAQLWESGFFRRNEAVRRELLDNSYSFFDQGSPSPPEGRKGLGCYARGGEGQDTIYLRKELFAYFEIRIEGIVQHPDVGRRVLPVLVHEICHDLWMNILDERERAAFTREGVDLMEDYCMAQTAEEKRRFLRRAGDDVSNPGRLRSYAGIEAILTACPLRTLRGRELFAWLAERLFMTKAVIPAPLRKYYSCILAEVHSGALEAPKMAGGLPAERED